MLCRSMTRPADQSDLVHLRGICYKAACWGSRPGDEALLEPFGLTRDDTAHCHVCTRHLDRDVHSPGKRNARHIECPDLTIRTRIQRLVRKTNCCATSTQMYDIVMGFVVNRYASGRTVPPWPSPLLKHDPPNFPRHIRPSRGAT
jgi:hypothetical protein